MNFQLGLYELRQFHDQQVVAKLPITYAKQVHFVLEIEAPAPLLASGHVFPVRDLFRPLLLSNDLDFVYLASRIEEVHAQRTQQRQVVESVLHAPQTIPGGLESLKGKNLVARLDTFGLGIAARLHLSNKAAVADHLIAPAVLQLRIVSW